MQKPKDLSSFIGQEHIIEDLKINIEAAKIKKEPLGHTIFFGPPGLGKTTLALLVAKEFKSRFYMFTGINLSTKKQVANVMANLRHQDVLFIDEIHALRQPIEELLYTPMQDFNYEAKPIHHFTLIGATTLAGDITKPLLDRMIHQYELYLYSRDTLAYLIWISSNEPITKDMAYEIAGRSKGVPRLARNYFHMIENQKIVNRHSCIEPEDIEQVFNRLAIDSIGLNPHDYKILKVLSEGRVNSPDGAVGLESLAIQTYIDKPTLVAMHEPYLLYLGFITRTSKGRKITRRGLQYMQEKGIE